MAEYKDYIEYKRVLVSFDSENILLIVLCMIFMSISSCATCAQTSHIATEMTKIRHEVEGMNLKE